MNGRRTMLSPRRVVIFAPHAASGGGGLEGLGVAPECVRTASAYEAAAELLAGPAEALVIELRVLRPCHVRLLEVARQSGAKVWGIGPLPPTSARASSEPQPNSSVKPWATNGQLSGVQAMSRVELAQALGNLAGRGPVEAQDETLKAPSAAAPGGEPLLTAEELSALLGDVE